MVLGINTHHFLSLALTTSSQLWKFFLRDWNWIIKYYLANYKFRNGEYV